MGTGIPIGGLSAGTSLHHVCPTAWVLCKTLSHPQSGRQRAQHHLCCHSSLNLFAEFLSPHPELHPAQKDKANSPSEEAFCRSVCLPPLSSDSVPKPGSISLLWGLETPHLSVVLNPGCTFESNMNVDQLKCLGMARAQVIF